MMLFQGVVLNKGSLFRRALATVLHWDALERRLDMHAASCKVHNERGGDEHVWRQQCTRGVVGRRGVCTNIEDVPDQVGLPQVEQVTL